MKNQNRKKIPRKLRGIILEKCNNKCAYCGCDITINEMQIDHVISHRNYIKHISYDFQIPLFLKHLTENDVDHFDNLMASCRLCNKHKASLSLEQFRDKIKSRIKFLNTHLYGANYRLAKNYGLVIEIDKPVVFFFEQI